MTLMQCLFRVRFGGLVFHCKSLNFTRAADVTCGQRLQWPFCSWLASMEVASGCNGPAGVGKNKVASMLEILYRTVLLLVDLYEFYS